MKQLKLYLCPALILVLAIGASACHSSHSHDEGKDEEHHEHEEGVIHFTHKQAKAAGLAVETIVAGDFAEALRVSGQVAVAQGDEAAIVAKSAGVIHFLRDHLSEGTPVKMGEGIARISAEGVAGGDLNAQNGVTLRHARETYERAKRLFADTLISKKELLAAQYEYEQAQLATGKSAGAAGGSVVTVPITGFVKSIVVKQGEYVELGQVIATITKNCNLQLRAEVPEKYFSDMYKVRSANFEMSYGGGAQSLDNLGGHLVSMGKTASAETAYIPITFEFENKGNIVPGAFADIWLLFNTRNDVISIPTSAITEEQGVYFVYVQLDDDEYEKREVVLGMDNGLRTEVKSGLKAGDKVVVKGVYQVKLAGAGAAPEAHSHQH